jgi:hypothetical protein
MCKRCRRIENWAVRAITKSAGVHNLPIKPGNALRGSRSPSHGHARRSLLSLSTTRLHFPFFSSWLNSTLTSTVVSLLSFLFLLCGELTQRRPLRRRRQRLRQRDRNRPGSVQARPPGTRRQRRTPQFLKASRICSKTCAQAGTNPPVFDRTETRALPTSHSTDSHLPTTDLGLQPSSSASNR